MPDREEEVEVEIDKKIDRINTVPADYDFEFGSIRERHGVRCRRCGEPEPHVCPLDFIQEEG